MKGNIAKILDVTLNLVRTRASVGFSQASVLSLIAFQEADICIKFSVAAADWIKIPATRTIYNASARAARAS